MKKPEEIKKALGYHGWMLCDKDCPYGGYKGSGYDCSTELCGDALLLIEQLESKLKQAVEDIRMLGRRDTDNFEWRGVKE
jgi:hypothetical protein